METVWIKIRMYRPCRLILNLHCSTFWSNHGRQVSFFLRDPDSNVHFSSAFLSKETTQINYFNDMFDYDNKERLLQKKIYSSILVEKSTAEPFFSLNRTLKCIIIKPRLRTRVKRRRYHANV